MAGYNYSGGYPQGQYRYPEKKFSLAKYPMPTKEEVANWVTGNLVQEALTSFPTYLLSGKTPEDIALGLASGVLARGARQFPVLLPVAGAVASYSNTPTPVKKVLNNVIFNAMSDPLIEEGKKTWLEYVRNKSKKF